MARLYLLLSTLGLVFLLASCEKANRVSKNEHLQGYVMTLDNDTTGYHIGADSGAFPFSELDKYDTTRLGYADSLTLFSRLDTITLYYDTIPVNMYLVYKNDTVRETIIFTRKVLPLLREYSAFGSTPVDGYKSFYCADSTDENLVRLRTEYNLDSVAGDGGEFERIINLMRWAHNIVRHDGNSKNPEPQNALNLIKVCREEDRGVNCRMMATILNEAYLAMGFKSRHVTCLPFDKKDSDCHVINMVYSKTLDKWLYMDPTFEAYYMDKDSNIVSILEAREMLIDGEELILNEEANWNGQPKDPLDYKRYMTKNLFRFSCPVGSEFGYESRDSVRVWIYLNPSGYDSELTAVADTSGKEGREFIKYYTDNSAFFWARP